MRILGFDTATPSTAVALWDQHAGLAIETRDDPPPGGRPMHTTRLMELVVETLERGASSWSQIDRIAVGAGPGTFTGLRIGIATARGLAQARGLPLVGISTLRSIAHGVSASTAQVRAFQPRPQEAVVAVLDARRGEVFAAGWPRARLGDPHAPALLAPVAIGPEALAELLAAERRPSLALGDGAVKFREVLERSGAAIPQDGSELHRVGAINLCRLAVAAREGSRDEVRPEYLRVPDAELARNQAQRR